MSDPFEQLLESALSGPELELGQESRRRLLEAAARPVAAAPNIVRFEVPDPDAESGFDWLAGESSVTRPLARRMTTDSGFLRMLDDERQFLRSLRSSLRRPAACPAVRPSRRGWIAACAAAMVIAAGTWWASMPVSRAGASSSAVAAATARPAAGLVPRVAVPAITTVRAMEGGAPPPVVEKPLLGADSLPLFAGVEVSEPAATAENEFPPFRLESLAVALEHPLIAALEKPSSGDAAFHTGMWQPGRMLERGFVPGPTLATSLGDGRSNIPEPSSVLLLMTGSLLAWHRRRPRNPPAGDPTR